jgi:hypothetical protein
MRALNSICIHIVSDQCFYKSTSFTVRVFVIHVQDLKALLFVQAVLLSIWKAISLVLDVREGRQKR